MKNVNREPNLNWAIIFICWIIASVSTLGSLFFSEIMELPPCALCWYQRVFMFPLVLILLVGLFPIDRNAIKYALPIAIAGIFCCTPALFRKAYNLAARVFHARKPIWTCLGF